VQPPPRLPPIWRKFLRWFFARLINLRQPLTSTKAGSMATRKLALYAGEIARTNHSNITFMKPLFTLKTKA